MHIAKIRKNGEISGLSLPQGLLNPAEGYNADEDMYIKYIDFDIGNRIDFMNNYYYNIEDNTFVERAPRPNPVAIWMDKQWLWDVDDFLDLVRKERNIRLFQTDWTQIPDTSLTTEQVEIAKTYRQALRDMISDCHSAQTLDDIPWPTKPDFL